MNLFVDCDNDGWFALCFYHKQVILDWNIAIRMKHRELEYHRWWSRKENECPNTSTGSRSIGNPACTNRRTVDAKSRRLYCTITGSAISRHNHDITMRSYFRFQKSSLYLQTYIKLALKANFIEPFIQFKVCIRSISINFLCVTKWSFYSSVFD